MSSVPYSPVQNKPQEDDDEKNEPQQPEQQQNNAELPPAYEVPAPQQQAYSVSNVGVTNHLLHAILLMILITVAAFLSFAAP